MTKVMFICHGNICRSPMAEFLFKDMTEKLNRKGEFVIASCATSTEEIGNPVHHGTREILSKRGISCKGKYAVQLTKNDYDKYDYFIVMDGNNLRNTMRIFKTDPDKKVYRLLDFAGGGDVADPWYTGNFDVTYDDITRGLNGFLKHIDKK